MNHIDELNVIDEQKKLHCHFCSNLAHSQVCPQCGKYHIGGYVHKDGYNNPMPACLQHGEFFKNPMKISA